MKFYSIVVAGLVSCGLVSAQSVSTAASMAPAKSVTKPVVTPKKDEKTYKVNNGIVLSVDMIGNTIKVQVKKAVDTLVVTDKTVIKPDGKKLIDFQSGARIQAWYTIENARMTVTELTLKKAAPPRK